MAEQTWVSEAFLDNTLLRVTITTDDADPTRGQDVGYQLHLEVQRLLSYMTLADAANRATGATFAEMRQRAQR